MLLLWQSTPTKVMMQQSVWWIFISMGHYKAILLAQSLHEHMAKISIKWHGSHHLSWNIGFFFIFTEIWMKVLIFKIGTTYFEISSISYHLSYISSVICYHMHNEHEFECWMMATLFQLFWTFCVITVASQALLFFAIWNVWFTNYIIYYNNKHAVFDQWKLWNLYFYSNWNFKNYFCNVIYQIPPQ